MTYYALNARNGNSYTQQNQSVGVLLMETGDHILTEAGDDILLENPAPVVPSTSRNGSSYTQASRN